MILNHGGSIVVDHSTPKPKVVGLKTITGNGQENSEMFNK
jgi:hypothetical protein